MVAANVVAGGVFYMSILVSGQCRNLTPFLLRTCHLSGHQMETLARNRMSTIKKLLRTVPCGVKFIVGSLVTKMVIK